MRDHGLFEKLASQDIPISATEESAKKFIDEQAEELTKLKPEAFYGPLFILSCGLVSAFVLALVEIIFPRRWFEMI